MNPDGKPKSNAEFVANVKKAFENTPAARFFKNNPKFIEELAAKAAALADDPSTPICGKDLLPKTAQVTMHQQVLYCGKSILRNGYVEVSEPHVSRADMVNKTTVAQ